MSNRKRKIATVAGAGMGALAIGAGLFAWSATNVTVSGVEAAGAANQTDGCFVGALTIDQNDPIYDTALAEWFVTGINVTGDTGSNASACAGYDLKVSYETVAGSTVQVGSITNLPGYTWLFAPNVTVADGTLPGVPTENIKNWQVVIASVDAPAAVMYGPVSFTGMTYSSFFSMYVQGATISNTYSAATPILGIDTVGGDNNYVYLSQTAWDNYKTYTSGTGTRTDNPDGSVLIEEPNGRTYTWRMLDADPVAGAATVTPLA